MSLTEIERIARVIASANLLFSPSRIPVGGQCVPAIMAMMNKNALMPMMMTTRDLVPIAAPVAK